tara:strand:+ start:91 stop:420 length:330 start_codon:yes stop_codon:yes gene_type:complete
MKDFFYINAIKSNDMPSKAHCEEILNKAYQPADCQGEEFNNNRQECLDRQLCKNKKLADTILDIQQIHSGSEGKYADSQSIFNRELFKTANLTIGIVGLMVLMYRFRKV